jgi:hypothetical protein
MAFFFKTAYFAHIPGLLSMIRGVSLAAVYGVKPNGEHCCRASLVRRARQELPVMVLLSKRYTCQNGGYIASAQKVSIQNQ